jgi:hypothetical protein
VSYRPCRAAQRPGSFRPLFETTPEPKWQSLGKLTTVAIEHSVGLQAPSAGEPGPSRRLIFGIVAVGLFMSSIDATIVATALSAIHTSLRTTINWAGWTLTVYSLGMVIVRPIAGKISDEFGRRRVFFCAVVLFTISSLLCGLSTDIYMLVGFRAIQGDRWRGAAALGGRPRRRALR